MVVHKDPQSLRKYLEWILEGISDVEKFVTWYKENTFLDDKKTLNACLMTLVHIWETVTRINYLYPDFELTNKQYIKGMRNFIAHDYMSIRPKIIWLTITKSLPVLKKEIEEAMQNL